MILLRELSFLMLGTGVEEFLEGCQIFLPNEIGLSTVFPIQNFPNFPNSEWDIKVCE